MDERSIPYQKLQDLHGSDFYAVYYARGSKKENLSGFMPHRDDNYLIIIGDVGVGSFEVDFHTVRSDRRSFFHVCPGQVHSNIEVDDAGFWCVLISPHLISKGYADILREYPRHYEPADISDQQYNMFDSTLRMLSELDRMPEVNRLNIRASLIELFINLCIQVVRMRSGAGTDDNAGTSRQDEIARLFCCAVMSEFPRIKKVNDFAEMLNISPVYLNEVVKSKTGLTPSAIIMDELILEVKRQLMFSNVSLKEVAYNVGYDEAYLSRLFKNKTGMSPTEFRSPYLK